jgi:hypothetical protein
MLGENPGTGLDVGQGADGSGTRIATSGPQGTEAAFALSQVEVEHSSMH